VLPLLRAFLQISLLQRGPQSLPASRELTLLVVAAHLALGIVFSLVELALGVAVASALVGTLLMVAVIQALLLIRGFSGRFHQTVTAMGGCELLIGIPASLLTAWYYLAGQSDIAALFSLLLVGWSLAITSHIFHHALETNRAASFGIALAYLFASYFAAGLFSPPGA